MVILSLALLSVVACRSSADGVGETEAEETADSGETGGVGETGETGGAGEPGDSGVTGDSGDTADTDGLVGEPLDPPLAPPTFAVLDQAGEERTEAWLVGHPTVLWCFREAEGST